MNVLVTGSTGFIGAQLCRALVAQGHQVRAFHRPTSTLRMIEDLPVEHVLGDLTRPETLRPAMEGIEVAFHVAAHLGGHQAGRMYTVTVEGTRAVLAAARQAGVRRVVHTSSVAALGIPDQNGSGLYLPLDERHTWNCRPDLWPYGYGKYLAELEVQQAVARGQDAVIVNPTYVVGPGDIYRQTSALVIQAARRRLRFLVEGGVNVVSVQDVVAGHLAACERGRTGERYILGGENLSYTRLAQLAAAVTNTPAPQVLLPVALVRMLSGWLRLVDSYLDAPVSASDLRLAGYYFYFSGRKAQVELGVPPPQPVGEALEQAYQWFRQVGALPGR